MDIFGGSSPYSQGGNGLGVMFRELVRTATPFLKSAAKKVGKRLLKTGVDTGMQIFGPRCLKRTIVKESWHCEN